MAQEIINIGSSENDGTGDALRNAFIKSNNNFTELYSGKQDTLISGTNIKTINGNSILGAGNLFISSGITGSGTDNYIPRFNGTTALENSIIYDNGTNVGIGTTTTQGKLHIRQTANLGGLVGNSLILQTIENSGGNGSNQVFIKDYAYRDAVGTDWLTWRHHNSIDIDGIYNTPGTNTRTFWERDPLSELHIFGSNTRKVLTIDASSNQRVGINIDTPSYPLHVSGNVSNISIYATNDIVAFSDQSVKTNIRPIENALERVVKSRGVLYDRTDSENKDNIGFIAQELEVNFPELVVTNEDGTKAVKYQNTVAVLFEAIKEQQKQIEELKQIVNGFTK